jgi:hypothetical protein
MKFSNFASPVIAAAMLAGIGFTYATPALASPAAQYVAQYGGQGPNWDTAPSEYREYQQRGFHDGVEGARKDFAHHRPFTPENRAEYRHPHVPPNVWEDYRQAFREGYHRAVENLYHGYGPR